MNFSSNVGIENCVLFRVRSCGSVLFYISFGSVRNRSVSAQSTVLPMANWPIVRPHKSKGPNKKRSGRTFPWPNFRRKGAEFYQNCFSPLILSVLGKCPRRNIVIFPLTQTKIVFSEAQISSKRENH